MGSSNVAQQATPRPRVSAGQEEEEDVSNYTRLFPNGHPAASGRATIGSDGRCGSGIAVAVLAWVAGVVCSVVACAYRTATRGGNGTGKGWELRANEHAEPNHAGCEHDDGEEAEAPPRPIVMGSACEHESDRCALRDNPFHQVRDSSGQWCEDCHCHRYGCICGSCTNMKVDDGRGSPHVGRGGGGDGGVVKRAVRGLVVADAGSRSTGQPLGVYYQAAVGAIHWWWAVVIACSAFCLGRAWQRHRTAAAENAVVVATRPIQPSRNRRDIHQTDAPAVPETPADGPGAALRRRVPARRELQTTATPPETVADEASMFHTHDHVHGTWPGQESSNDSEDGLPGEAPEIVGSDGTDDGDDGDDDRGAHVAGQGSSMHAVAHCRRLQRAQWQSWLTFCPRLRGIAGTVEITGAWAIYGTVATQLCCTSECCIDRHGWQRGWRLRKLKWCGFCADSGDALNPPRRHPR